MRIYEQLAYVTRTLTAFTRLFTDLIIDYWSIRKGGRTYINAGNILNIWSRVHKASQNKDQNQGQVKNDFTIEGTNFDLKV